MTKCLVGALVLGAAAITVAPLSHAQSFTVELTRFGLCSGSNCVIEIIDNGALDNNAASGVIAFNQAIVGEGGDVFSASGIATEIINVDPFNTIESIQISLNEVSVRGSVGTATDGQIGLTSSEPLISLTGVTGSAQLNGHYETSFGSGVIGIADVSLRAQLDGVVLGLADPAPGSGGQSPLGFSEFDQKGSSQPVAGKLFGALNFTVGANDGFFLPGSTGVRAELLHAQPVPEPSSFLLFGFGAVAAGVLSLRRRRAK